DAAATVIIGSDAVLAEIVATGSRSDDFLDEWRRDRDWYVQSQPSKYSVARGYQENIEAVSRSVLEKAGLTPAEVTIAKPAPEFGSVGTAAPLLALAHALAEAKPGALILCTAYGEGADAVLLRVIRSGPPIQPETNTIEY